MQGKTRKVMKKAALGGAAALTMALLGAGCKSDNAQVKILDPREVVPTPYYDPAPVNTPVAASATVGSFGQPMAPAASPSPSVTHAPSVTPPAPADDPVFARPTVPDNSSRPAPTRQQTSSTGTHTIVDTVAVSYDLEPEFREVEPLSIPTRPTAPADDVPYQVPTRSDVVRIADTPELEIPALPVPSAGGMDSPRRHDVDPLTYQVQSGDSLWKIGKMYGVSSSELAMANNMDKDDTLSVGRVLTIPAGGRMPSGGAAPVALASVTPTSTGTSTTVREAVPSSGTYTVSKGDSLWSIGMKYNITVATMEGMNPHLGRTLQPGDTVYLTESAARSAPTVSRTPAPRVSTPDRSTEVASTTTRTATGSAGDIVAAPADRFTPPSQNTGTVRLFSATPTGGASNIPATHTVASGDSLWKIAKKHGVSVAEIKALNNLTSDRLDIGDVLRLRADGGGATTTTATTTTSTTATTTTKVTPAPGGSTTVKPKIETQDASKLIRLPHFVEPGDSLAEIANMYNSNVEWILDANPQLKNGGKLQDQKQIMVPVPDDNGF